MLQGWVGDDFMMLVLAVVFGVGGLDVLIGGLGVWRWAVDQALDVKYVWNEPFM